MKHKEDRPFEMIDTDSLAHKYAVMIEINDSPIMITENKILIIEARDYAQVMKDLNDRGG